MTNSDEYVIHFLNPLTVPTSTSINACSQIYGYGDEVTVTAELREAGLDRNGDSWLDLVDDEGRQMARWGSVVFRRGPWPKDLPRLEPGSDAWADAREAARIEAHKVENSSDRAAKLREVDARFGPAPMTSQTLAHYDNGEMYG